MCLEVLEWSFKVCLNGHSLCTGCIKDLKACPTCQASFALEDAVLPIFVKDLMESLPQFCRYRDLGCEEIFDRKHNHEDHCGFRPFICQERKCNMTIPLSMLMEHYKKVHSELFIMRNTQEKIIWNNFNPKKKRSSFIPVFFKSNWFWLEIENDIDEQCFRLDLYSTLIGEVKVDYFVKVQFEGEIFSYVYTIKAYESVEYRFDYNEGVLDKSIADDMSTGSGAQKGDRVFTMEIPQSSLKHFINAKGELEFNLVFFCTSKENL